MPLVFLSYARQDAVMADRIAADLQAKGISVWLDRDSLNPGESWVEQFEGAISRSDFLLFFISRSSLKSKWALVEYRAAFTALRKSGGTTIVPVLLEEVGQLPPFLASIQYADFTKSYSAGVRSLVRALQKPTGPKPNEIVDSKKLVHEVAGEVAKLLGLENPGVRPARGQSDQNLVF